MPSRRAASLAALLVLVLALTACGGDGDDSTAGSTDPESTEPAAASAAPAGSDEPLSTTADSAGGTATAPSSSGGDDAKFCPKMQEIAEFNGSQPDPDPSQPWDDYKAEAMQLEESLELYETAIASAPEEIRPQLESLRDVSVEGFEALEQSSSLEEFTAAVEGLFTEDILTATQELDAFLQEACGFGLTS